MKFERKVRLPEKTAAKNLWAATWLLSLAAALFAAGSAAAATAVNLLANGDFEKGLQGWKTFRAKPPKAKLSVTNEARGGKDAVKVVATGKHTNEGIRTEVKGLAPNSIYIISAYVKGSGTCRIFAFDGKWTYGPRTTLSEQWQKVEIRKPVTRTSMTVHIVSDTKYDKTPPVFILDDVRVVKQKAKSLPSTEAKPVVHEAEDFAVADKNVGIVKDASAGRGAYVRAYIRWVYMARNVPCPQTERPVYLYAKVWMSDAAPTCLSITSMQTTHSRFSVPKPNQWTWVRCDKPLDARHIGETFNLTVSSDKKRVETRLDTLILTTRNGLTPKALQSLAAGRRMPSDRGIVMIAGASTPPVIDGALTDPCWSAAVEVTPFALRGMTKRGKTAFAKEQTSVRLCYDANNLYVSFKCAQSVLDPMNNQLGAFKKNTAGHDLDSIWNDEYVLIMLDTNLDRKGFFNLMINGIGAMLDERCPPEAPWRKRDKTWESNAEVKTKIGNGYWTVEGRIPFKDLAVSPKLGDHWGLGLGRINRAAPGKGAPSTWQPMEGGYHNAEEFGVLKFGSAVPGVTLIELPELRPGRNTIRFKACNPKAEPANLRVGIEAVDEAGKACREFADYSLRAKEAKDLTFTYPVAAEGLLRFQHFVANPATLTRYYQSPRYLMRVQTSALTIKMESKQGYSLYVNGNHVGRGTQGTRTYTHPLYQGINTIALETADKDITVTYKVGRETFGLDRTWRFATTRVQGWSETSFDDTGWERWERKQATGKRLYLRKDLLFRQSKIWPPNGGIHVAIGTVTSFWHWLNGMKGRTLTGYRFSIELPEGAELAGATAFDYVRNYGNRILDITKTPVVRDKKTYTRYTLRFKNPVHALSRNAMRRSYSHCYLGIVATRDLGKDAKLYYHIETDRFTEVPNAERIICYPALNAKRPKNQPFICWGSAEMYGHSPSLEEAIVKGMSQCGFTHYTCRKKYADKYGLKVFGPGAEWPSGLMALSSSLPELQRVDEEGNKIKPIGWCPSLLQDERAIAFLKRTYAKAYAEKRYDAVMWDLECNPFRGRATCWCRDCLARFRTSAGLPKDTRLTPKIIKDKYSTQWITFMCHQTELTARVLKSVIKQQNPQTVFSVYSGYESPANRGHYSIDWAMIAPHIDVAVCGYGRRPKEIQATLDAVAPHNVPLLGGILVDCPFETMEPPHPNQTRKVEVIRRVLDCRGGVFFMTPTRGMDARSYTSFAEATRFIADCEGFFVKRDYDRTLIAGKNIPDDHIAVLRQGKETLILLLNDGSGNMRGTLKLSRKLTGIRDYYNNGKVGRADALTLQATVPPYDFVALICD